MTVTTALTKEIVNDTTYCRLDMRLGATSLDVMIYNPMEDNSLICRHIELPIDETERRKAIETFIYDNPLLLSNFKSVTAILESRTFITVPSPVVEAVPPIDLLREMDGDIDRRSAVIEDHLDAFDARILTPAEAQTINFLRRTFPNIRIHNALLPFTRYCYANLAKGNTVKVFVNTRVSSLDIVVMSSNTLYLINRFEYRDINDAAFYILNCTEERADDISEILIGGNREQRDALMPLLRKFRPYVMPMIFPSAMFRAGSDALKAPFDQIILPLCE